MICKKVYVEGDVKVRGSSHSDCSIKVKINRNCSQF